MLLSLVFNSVRHQICGYPHAHASNLPDVHSAVAFIEYGFDDLTFDHNLNQPKSDRYPLGHSRVCGIPLLAWRKHVAFQEPGLLSQLHDTGPKLAAPPSLLKPYPCLWGSMSSNLYGKKGRERRVQEGEEVTVEGVRWYGSQARGSVYCEMGEGEE